MHAEVQGLPYIDSLTDSSGPGSQLVAGGAVVGGDCPFESTGGAGAGGGLGGAGEAAQEQQTPAAPAVPPSAAMTARLPSMDVRSVRCHMVDRQEAVYAEWQAARIRRII